MGFYQTGVRVRSEHDACDDFGFGDCRICARLHDLSEIVEHNSPSGHLALQYARRWWKIHN